MNEFRMKSIKLMVPLIVILFSSIYSHAMERKVDRALHASVRQCDLRATKFWLFFRANANVKDLKGNPPLHEGQKQTGI